MAGKIREALRWSAPSVLTTGALLSGLTAVRLASEEQFNGSVTFVLTAAVLDGLDGHVARFLGSCTKLGFELDSLCDLANFGVSPSLIVYFWAKALPTSECRWEGCWVEHHVIWVSCCIYAACCAFRLARFNVAGHAEQMDAQHMVTEAGIRPPVPTAVMHNFRQRKMYFQGVPAPVGAAYALTPLMLRFSRMPPLIGFVGEPRAWAIGRRGSAVTLVATAVLMVSPLPTFSSKMLKTDRDDTHLRSRHAVSLAAKVTAGMLFCCLCWHFPFELMLLLNLVHLISIPVAVATFYFLANEKHE